MKYQVIIIGGGPAGYTAAEAAGKVPAPCRKAFKAVPNGPYHKE